MVSLEAISAFISSIVDLLNNMTTTRLKGATQEEKNLISAKDDGEKLGPLIPEYIANLRT